MVEQGRRDQTDPPNLSAAQRWYERSAEGALSDGNSWFYTCVAKDLARLFADKMTPPDLAAAQHWYEKAVDAGDDSAMTDLGDLFADKMDPPDLAAAQHTGTKEPSRKPGRKATRFGSTKQQIGSLHSSRTRRARQIWQGRRAATPSRRCRRQLRHAPDRSVVG